MIDLRALSHRRYAIMGFGLSGQRAARALTNAGAEVTVWDDSEQARTLAAQRGFSIEDLRARQWSADRDVLVWSPGIPHLLPVPHPVAEAARGAGVEPVCDIELFCRALPDARIVAVTGTNGKSTTTALIGHLLVAGGKPHTVGGNIGNPVLDLPMLPRDGFYVFELSSYQLELIRSLKPNIAVLLNISEDHLDRHGGMAGYVRAKSRIFDRTHTAVLGLDDDHCREIHAALKQRSDIHTVPISVSGDAPGGFTARGTEILAPRGETIADLSHAENLPGAHNVQNALAASAVARLLDLPDRVIARGIKTFPGLAHRQERICLFQGISFVNDSKATNAESTARALVCYDKVHWIAGGRPKESGIEALRPHFSRIRHAYLIGEAQDRFADTLGKTVPHSKCGDLETAVFAAGDAALKAKDPVVLLSPACASFDQFANFEERGEAFTDYVLAFRRFVQAGANRA